MKKIKLKIKPNADLIKIIIISSINLSLLVFSILIIQKLPQVASEVKTLNNKYVLSHENLDQAVLESDLAGNKQKTSTLESFFPDENGVLNFISEMEKLKNEGTISSFSFQSDKPITNKSNSQGFPILILSEGQIGSVNQTLEKINSLPFFFQPIEVKLSISDDNTIHLDYGGFLFVRQ